MTYQPKTGARCGCRRGVQRDNCPTCEGTGFVIDFAKIRARSACLRNDATFEGSGFFLESFLGVWIKHANGRTATIADGQSINGHAHEVQVTTDDGEFIDGSSAEDLTTAQAIALANSLLR